MCGAGGADRAAAQGAGVTGNGLLRGGAEELQRTQNCGGPGPSEAAGRDSRGGEGSRDRQWESGHGWAGGRGGEG